VGARDESAAGRETPPGALGTFGYRGTVACTAAGITYRQLDYWARTGLAGPSLRTGSAPTAPGLYSFRDVVILKIVKRLLDVGVSLHNIRAAVAHLGTRAAAELAGITLLSDGAGIFECTSPAEVMELLQGGQGVFGISVGAVCAEVEDVLRQLPGEEPAAGEAELPRPVLPPGVVDELAARRRFRAG
jgi:DNA-binding transcriptional MerR regulator